MPHIHEGANIEVPAPDDPSLIRDGAGGYTGFNSQRLNEIYVCERREAYRSQIAHGWGKPIIQRMPNGDLLASGFCSIRERRNPRYPDAHEESALFRSHDEGRTWSEPRLLGIPGRISQMSVLSGGEVVMAVNGGRQPVVQDVLYRSDNGGESFVECEVPWDEFSRDNRPGVGRTYGETNGVLELPDGTLLVVCCTIRPPIERYTDFNAYIIRSADRGRTWGDASFVLNTDEIELLQSPGGKLLGFARLDTSYSRDVWGQGGQIGEGGDQMALMESTDFGRTWTDPRPIGLGMAQIPGFPLMLPDGRLLLIYGNRQFPFGCQVIASTDMGLTWDLEHFLMLAWASWDNYGGHPRSILMDDGSVITGYYARYFKENVKTINQDIVSHCLRWHVPADWPPRTR